MDATRPTELTNPTEPTGATNAAEVRRAGPVDAAALVRLRAVMYAGMGHPVDEGVEPGGDEGAEPGWRPVALAWFADHLRQPERFAAYVAEVGGRVVSAAVGLVIDHPPSPANPSTVRGYVFNVATEPDQRRRGLGNACLTGLLNWFATETSVRVVDLTSTGDGSGLYVAHGFRETGYPSMRLTLPEREAGDP